MQTASLGGAKYFVTFINDFTRKVWIYLLKDKSKTFETFKEFKQEAENEFGMKIKVLRSDNGGEYNSKEFNQFCKKHGIKRQFSTPHTPQQNGVVDQMNKSLQEKARAMMKAKNLSTGFQGETVKTTTYLTNKSSTKAVWNKTPKEAWVSIKPTVNHLQIFKCTTYMHVPKEKRQKLDNKSSKCIFLGYSEVSKAYKVYELKTKKLHMSRDVIFDEGYGLKEVDLGDFQLGQDIGKEVEEQPKSNSSSEAKDSEFNLINSLPNEDLFDVGEGEVANKPAEPSQGPKKNKKKVLQIG